MAFNPNQPREKDGKWGAGGAGGGHSAGVNSVGKPVVHPSVVETIRNSPEGFSVTPSGESPTKGYMVSIPGRTKILDKGALAGHAAQGIIDDYARKNADVLGKSGAHIGGWHDKDSGKVYLDVSQNVASQREATKLGKLHNQIAIWDVKRKREIHTGGTGE